jgi:hypothetical protein
MVAIIIRLGGGCRLLPVSRGLETKKYSAAMASLRRNIESLAVNSQVCLREKERPFARRLAGTQRSLPGRRFVRCRQKSNALIKIRAYYRKIRYIVSVRKRRFPAGGPKAP